MLQHMLGRIFLSPLERRNTSEKGRPCHSPPRKLLFGCCEALAPLKEQTGADSNYCNQRFLNIWDKILVIKVRFFFFFLSYMERYFFLVMYVLCPVLGWWTASCLPCIRLEESSAFRNILLTRSIFSELSMDVFASENSKRSWFLCLEISGHEWRLAKLAVFMQWWGNTALRPDVLFYTRSASLCCVGLSP